MLSDQGKETGSTIVGLCGEGGSSDVMSMRQPPAGLTISNVAICCAWLHLGHSRWWMPTISLTGTTDVRSNRASHFGQRGRSGIARA